MKVFNGNIGLVLTELAENIVAHLILKLQRLELLLQPLKVSAARPIMIKLDLFIALNYYLSLQLFS